MNLCELFNELLVRDTILKTGADTASERIAVCLASCTNGSDEDLHRFSFDSCIDGDVETAASGLCEECSSAHLARADEV